MRNSLKLAIALKPEFGRLPELLQLNIYHNWLMFKGLKSRPKNPMSKEFITLFVDTLLPSVLSVRSIHIYFNFSFLSFLGDFLSDIVMQMFAGHGLYIQMHIHCLSEYLNRYGYKGIFLYDLDKCCIFHEEPFLHPHSSLPLNFSSSSLLKTTWK